VRTAARASRDWSSVSPLIFELTAMLTNRKIKVLTEGLAAAMLAGSWERKSLLSKTAEALGHKWPWRRDLITHLLAAYESAPSYDKIFDAIGSDSAFRKAVNTGERPRIAYWFPSNPVMETVFPEWDLPKLDNAEDVGLFLDLDRSKLAWLADCEDRQRRSDEVLRRHYNYQWLRKPGGGWRLIQAPKYLLKQVQRRIVDGILNRIPLHDAACGFRRGRSIIDYATPHTGKAAVMHLDLANFFPSIRASRVHALFVTLGYPKEVARVLAGLCTTSVPMSICRRHASGNLHNCRHLPQGAPTSPAIANLCAFGLDRRLQAAAETVGVTYTRYADDLAFSGDDKFARASERFLPLVWQVAADEGFEVNHRKTRTMRQSGRQRLTGLVLNKHLNVCRKDYDLLKAILTNCIRHDPKSQNRAQVSDFQSHLRGKMAFVEQVNPHRGAKLHALFDQIVW
jgi:RNA-directed DNA polymerase